MHAGARVAGVVVLSSVSLSFLVATGCSGGADSGPTDGGASSTSSSSGGSSSGSSGVTPSDGGACTELHLGGTNDPAIGGGATSQVVAQATSDLAGASPAHLADLTAACKAVATALGADATDQQTADAKTDPREKVDAWCKIATRVIQTAKGKAGGNLSVQVPRAACRTALAVKAECQGRCAGTPCDVSANPMVCTGGLLTADFCEGGKLEGGCQVDARCDGACDMTVNVKADCPKPSVTVSSSGASDPATAATLKAALEGSLPTIVALKNHCRLEADIASSFTGTLSAATDLKAACIPPLVAAAQRSVQDVIVCANASTSVLTTLNVQ